MLVPVVAAVLASLVGACTQSGSAVAVPGDLTSRAVTAEEFPNGRATRVPPQGVAPALDDLLGSGTPVTPADCAVQRVPADGAVLFQAFVSGGTADAGSSGSAAPGAGAGGTTASFTSAVVRADQPLDAELERAHRCPRVTTGAVPAMSEVRSEVLDAPDAPSGVTTGAVRRIAETGPTAAPLPVAMETLMAQRGDTRVYVQYRTPGTAIGAQAREQLGELFDRAVAAAFG